MQTRGFALSSALLPRGTENNQCGSGQVTLRYKFVLTAESRAVVVVAHADTLEAFSVDNVVLQQDSVSEPFMQLLPRETLWWGPQQALGLQKGCSITIQQ